MSVNVIADTKVNCTAVAYMATADVFAVFGPPVQDSGNLSYGVRQGNTRFYVKTAGRDRSSPGVLARADRIALLRNAVTLSQTTASPGLARLRNVIEASDGPILVYEWVVGEALGGTTVTRASAGSAHQRFRTLPTEQILDAIDVVFSLHRDLAAAKWVAVDFYDGSLLYDFARRCVMVIDLDHYHRGAFLNHMGRMFGSERFMAPEEFVVGAQIDERTTVFTLGRLLSVFVGNGTLQRSAFRGSSALYTVMVQACSPNPYDRFDSVRSLYAAWKATRTS